MNGYVSEMQSSQVWTTNNTYFDIPLQNYVLDIRT